MSTLVDSDITQLVRRASSGDPKDVEALWTSLYAELRSMARAMLRGANRRLAPGETTLVHELYLKSMAASAATEWQGRRHFFGSMSRAMMQIVVDHRRRTRRAKRGGPDARMQVLRDGDAVATFEQMMLAVDAGLPDAMERLQAACPTSAEVVHLRFVAGLSIEATAEITGLSPRGVTNHWHFARAWLRREMSGR